jgi:hypothetical protein
VVPAFIRFQQDNSDLGAARLRGNAALPGMKPIRGN